MTAAPAAVASILFTVREFARGWLRPMLPESPND
jgi:hypothetical protein